MSNLRTPQQIWTISKIVENHPYLITKEVIQPNGLRFGPDAKGNQSTIVPFYNIETGELQTVQFIHPKKNDDDPGKFFLTGYGDGKKAAFIIGNISTAQKIYVCEGLATGISISMAIQKDIDSGISVVASCGSSKNIGINIPLFISKYPHAMIIACLDTGKAGLKEREKLQAQYSHIIFKEPQMENANENVDFNDLHVTCGINTVTQQLTLSLVEEKAFQTFQEIDETLKDLSTKELLINNILPPIKENNPIDTEDKLITADQLIEEQDTRRMLYQGKEFIGLPQRILPKLDELLSGLRKFIVLAAAPNVGKTALTIQLLLDTINHNSNTCALFISLEMSRNDIMDRMRCYLSGMTWNKLIFGNTKEAEHGFYTQEEHNQLDVSAKKIKTIGYKILIQDNDSCKDFSAENIINMITELKKQSKSKKAIVIIDYLQVFPINDTEESQLNNENAIDRHRIKQIQKIRDSLRNDPLIVIAEARKPSGSEKVWGVSIADILGSSRIAYACDAGILLNAISDEELIKELKCNKEDCPNIREALSELGISILKLTIDKGRDGMRKSNILLFFHFFKNKFEEVSWINIKMCKEIQPYLNTANKKKDTKPNSGWANNND